MVVAEAAANGWAEQRRRLRSGFAERVFACRSKSLARAVSARSLWTGGEID
jgi:hypothetical protein